MLRKQIGFSVACAVMVASTPREAIAADAETLYSNNCAICHGADGSGNGAAAYLLQSKPRDFRKGDFRIVSTDNQVPTEADLVRTITKGLPGTPMPPWPQLSDADKKGLAKHIMGFQRAALIKKYLDRDKTQAEAEEKADSRLKPGKVVNVQPPTDEANPKQLKASFVTLCAPCHAEDGTGRDDPKWRTSEGYNITSRNFKKGVFKGGRDDIDLYRRILLGMRGTPMPSYEAIAPNQIWRMVRYIQSLSDPKSQADSWIEPAAITVHSASTTPSKVTDAAWNSVTPSEVRMFELWTHPEAVRSVTIRAVSDGKNLALLLSWRDPQQDIAGRSTTTFNDRAALMLSTDANPPLFTMGRPDRSVEIWQWAPARARKVSNIAHNDIYPSATAGWAAERSDEGVFATATSVDNPISSGHGGGTLFKAAQFGSLTAAGGKETPTAEGQWADGEWRVMFRRALSTARKDDIDLSGGKVSIAFGIWDGRLGQRDGRKSVSIWGNLQLSNGGSK